MPRKGLSKLTYTSAYRTRSPLAPLLLSSKALVRISFGRPFLPPTTPLVYSAPKMSGFRRFELLDFPSSSLFYNEVSLYKPHTPLLFPFTDDVEDNLDFALDLLNPAPLPSPLDLFYPLSPPLSPLELFDGAAELPQLERAARRAETELCLRSLNARVAALELGFGRAIGHEMPEPVVDRKYKWTAEIKGPEKEKGFDRTYKLMAEVSGKGEKSLKWTAEMKGKGRDAALSRTYTYQKSTSPGKKAKAKGGEKKDKATETDKKGKKEKAGSESRIVEIEEPASHGAIVLRQAFARRTVNQSKGKKKELSPQDAALIIQMTFRAHLVRRSQVLRGLRDLAVAKAKLKEIRALFYNFSYRRRIVNDAEERQRFSEKIIVLLLTVEAIEGLDFMVRAAKKSMVDELEAMLDVVDPQQYGKLGSLKRRQFDLPVGGTISKEMARDVAGVVQMLDEDWGSA